MLSLQRIFKEHKYIDIFDVSAAAEYNINLNDLFEPNPTPDELIGIYISKHVDELYLLLNGDLKPINTLCKDWDKRIRVFVLLNGRSEIIKKLKFNIVQLIVCSNMNPQDKKEEGDLDISRKIIVNGDLSDIHQISITDETAIELPFYMINPDTFVHNTSLQEQLDNLLPIDKNLTLVLTKAHDKPSKGKGDVTKKILSNDEYNLIKGWINK